MLSQDETKYQEAVELFIPKNEGLTFIEQLQIASSKPCTKLNVPYLIGVNEDARVAVLTKTTCKMWNCETCGLRNAKRWIAKVINGVNKLGGEWFFLTITAHEKTRKSTSVLNIRSGWKKLYNRILGANEKTSTNIFYCKVWEQHENGSFHLHILINCNISKKWLKKNARECGMGYQAESRQIGNAGQIAGYMAKYSLKNATIARNNVNWPKGLRRIETSQKWPELPDIQTNASLGWIIKFDRESQLFSANEWNLRGFEIVDTVKE